MFCSFLFGKDDLPAFSTVCEMSKGGETLVLCQDMLGEGVELANRCGLPEARKRLEYFGTRYERKCPARIVPVHSPNPILGKPALRV